MQGGLGGPSATSTRSFTLQGVRVWNTDEKGRLVRGVQTVVVLRHPHPRSQLGFRRHLCRLPVCPRPVQNFEPKVRRDVSPNGLVVPSGFWAYPLLPT